MVHNRSRDRRQLTSIMIGAIEEFEEGFGYIWGHNEDGELTDKQKHFLDIWLDVRTRILDRGNDKINYILDTKKRIIRNEKRH